MIKVYGYSDDIVEIEHSKGGVTEIDCYERNVRIAFRDGTKILVGYCKPDLGVWWIVVEKQGTAPQKLTICEDEDAEIYSDIFEIDSPILGWVILKKEGGGEE
jgi:hypothetical protein